MSLAGAGKVLGMATLSLQKMAAGGMYDHVGGGFHRYRCATVLPPSLYTLLAQRLVLCMCLPAFPWVPLAESCDACSWH